MLTPDSLLPRPSYERVPGWFVASARGLPRHIGVPNDSDPRAFTGIMIDSGIIVFPADTAWLRVGTLTPLTLVDDAGARTIQLEAVEPDRETPGMVMRIRPQRAADAMKLGMGWLLPARVRDVAALPISRETAPDSASRSWTTGGVRLRLRITGPRDAELWAERDGMAPKRVRRVRIDAAADSSMGVETDTLLTLSNWRMPSVLQAFRFGADGPVVVIIHTSGYECSNFRLVVFRESHIDVIDDPHYFECQR